MKMKPERKSLLFTIGFYVFYIIATAIAGEIDRGGPCAPGLGAMMLLFLMPLSIIMLVASVILHFSGTGNYKSAMIVHGSVAGLFMVAMLFL
jgi:hypothetical protein